MTFGRETKISAVINISELIDVLLMIQAEEDLKIQTEDQKEVAAILPRFQKDDQRDLSHLRNKLHHLDHKVEKLGDLELSNHVKI